MGGAFATGLLKTDLFKPEDITVANPHEGKLKPFAEQGTSVTTDNKVAAAVADIVVLAVKPKVVKGVIDEIKEELDYSKQTIVNMAASIKLDQLEAWLISGGDVPASSTSLMHSAKPWSLTRTCWEREQRWPVAALPTCCASSARLQRQAWSWVSRPMMPRTSCYRRLPVPPRCLQMAVILKPRSTKSPHPVA